MLNYLLYKINLNILILNIAVGVLSCPFIAFYLTNIEKIGFLIQRCSHDVNSNIYL